MSDSHCSVMTAVLMRNPVMRMPSMSVVMGVFFAQDQPGPRWSGGEADQSGDLGDPAVRFRHHPRSADAADELFCITVHPGRTGRADGCNTNGVSGGC
jgi:hypothetical protein